MKVSDGCRLLGFAVLAAAISEPTLAAKFTDQEHTRIEEPRPAGLPSDIELETAGAVIGKVEIDIRNIFDQTDPRETNGLFRLANRLHIRTKRSSIQAQLLFASGDRYRARKLAETERALRLLSYIYDARIVPVHYAGGSNSTNFNLQDTNFLGWGKALQVSHGSTVDRTSNTVAWADPNVFGSKWTSAAAYVGSSDGTERVAQVAHPFYSLDTPWSTQITAVKYDRTISRYNLGEKVDQFNDNESSYELSGGLSNGLVDGWTKRLTFGVRYDRNLFLPTPGTGIPARQLPPDRTLSYPFVGFDILQDKYQKIGDENQIGRTEDLYFGTEVSGEVGWVNSAFGADRNAVLLRAHVLRGIELTELQQIFMTSNFTSRIEDGQARNLIADAGAKYYWRWRTDWLLYAELSGTVTDSLDPDLQVLLGGDNGLRGYPLRYESGTSRALLTVEQRFYTDWFPFRLVRVGGAMFADVGRTWGSGVVGNSDPGLLRDVGFGLRIGNTRSGLGDLLPIDFAVPLNHIAGIQRFQFLVQTMQSF